MEIIELKYTVRTGVFLSCVILGLKEIVRTRQLRRLYSSERTVHRSYYSDEDH